MIDPVALVSAGAALIAATAGAAAFLNGRQIGLVAERTQVVERANAAREVQVKESAELNRAEVEGWTTLIETLRKEYVAVVTEAAVLRGRLDEKERHIERLGDALREAHDLTVVLEERLEVLRAAVIKLGGDIDEINRIGDEDRRAGPAG